MRGLMLVLYSLAGGILMTLFMMTPGMFRYIFSLGAILLGVRFFRQYESKWARTGFIVLAALLSLFLPVVYVALAVGYGWPVDPVYLKGLQPKS